MYTFATVKPKNAIQGKRPILPYRREGNGPPLVLIHGWGVSYTIWRNLAPMLLPHFELIMVELPGIGDSPSPSHDIPYYRACAEALETLRVHLDIERWSVFAYSIGTRAAEIYTQEYPERVQRALMLCPLFLPEWWSIAVHLLDSVTPQMFANWLLSDWRLQTFIRAFGFNWRYHNYTKIWQDEIAIQPIDTLLRTLCELPGKGRARFAVPESIPTLYIWGRQDPLIARPRRPRSNDIFIKANHSAPMMEARAVANLAVPFLMDQPLPTPVKMISSRKRVSKRTQNKQQQKAARITMPLKHQSGRLERKQHTRRKMKKPRA